MAAGPTAIEMLIERLRAPGVERRVAVPVTAPIGRQHPYYQLADMQRGAPESQMLRVQQAMGGGVLNPVVEHGGDVIHRMNEFYRGGWSPTEAVDVGRGYVTNKTDKVLGYLQHPYGFEREFGENIRNNAKYKGGDEDKYRDVITQQLRAYAGEHGKLPVYNLPQRLAREAAVAVGEQRWSDATRLYRQLNELAKNPEGYARAMQGGRD